MRKAKSLQVIGNRVSFRCPGCGSRRNFAIAPGVRQKNIRCHRCGETTKCRLNRRAKNRESQAGKVILIGAEGKELEVLLYDISPSGVGFDLPLYAFRAKALSVGDEVKFKCGWNPRLFGNNRFIIKNIHGRRVGAVRITQGGL
ncbi:MAG: hypothetical protein ABFS19_01380 [Thermodesulfobacteriota bacterium]